MAHPFTNTQPSGGQHVPNGDGCHETGMAVMRRLLAVVAFVAQHKGMRLCCFPEMLEYHTQRCNEPLVHGLW